MVSKFLLKTTEEYWLSDLASVEAFHKELQQDAAYQDYQLTSFAYVEKPIKEGKDIVGSYFTVKATKVFDNAKEPEGVPMETVTYERKNTTAFDGNTE